MGKRVQGWRNLSWHQRGGIAGLALMLVPIHASLRMFGYTRSRQWLERLSKAPHPRQPTASEVDEAWRLAELASIAGRHGLVNASCLRQSLLLYFLLRRRGLTPALMLGVRRQQAAFDAHAWVVLNGIALGQRELAHAPLTEPTLRRDSA